MDLFTAPAAAFLSTSDQLDLILAAQDVPLDITTDDDGAEVLVYGKTPESEVALDTLTRAFMPTIRKSAGLSKMLDADTDALGVVLVEFIEAVRRYDTTSSVPFSATISTILQRRVSDTDRTSDLITVKENVAARYWRLMHKHGMDVASAYAECATTSNGFDPQTFLAVHRAIGVESIDVTFGADDRSYTVSHGGAANTSKVEGFLGATGSSDFADQLADRDLVRWLLDPASPDTENITPRQSSICRAAYGFSDLATENLMVEHNLRPGDIQPDLALSGVFGGSRPGIQRERKAALVLMAAKHAAAEEEARA